MTGNNGVTGRPLLGAGRSFRADPAVPEELLMDPGPSTLSGSGTTTARAAAAEAVGAAEAQAPAMIGGHPHGSFAGLGEPADVAVLVVTYNNALDIDPLIAGLRLRPGSCGCAWWWRITAPRIALSPSCRVIRTSSSGRPEATLAMPAASISHAATRERQPPCWCSIPTWW